MFLSTHVHIAHTGIANKIDITVYLKTIARKIAHKAMCTCLKIQAIARRAKKEEENTHTITSMKVCHAYARREEGRGVASGKLRILTRKKRADLELQQR
jgi:hypothetical protein